MSSLAYCLDLFGDRLSSHDKDMIKKYVALHKKEGRSAGEANWNGVNDYI